MQGNDMQLLVETSAEERAALLAKPNQYLVLTECEVDGVPRAGSMEVGTDEPIVAGDTRDPAELSDFNPRLAWTYETLRRIVPAGYAERGQHCPPESIRVTQIVCLT